MTRGMSRHISCVVSWKHINSFSVSQTNSHIRSWVSSCFSAAHRVQVQDNFPRLRLHFLHNAVGLHAVLLQTEAAQQTHLHDGHACRVQAQLPRQTEETATRLRENSFSSEDVSARRHLQVQLRSEPVPASKTTLMVKSCVLSPFVLAFTSSLLHFLQHECVLGVCNDQHV